MTRVLIGGVGYRNLRDHSFGVVLSDELAARDWPPSVVVEDLSYNPIAVVQRLQDESAVARFALGIIVGALQRPGRAAGTLLTYRWDQALPAPDAIHDAVTEAVTGIISLDNTLIVAKYFGALPDTVVVVELEPHAHECGDTFTPKVALALEHARGVVTELALAPASALLLPEGALPAGRLHHTGVVFQRIADDDTRIH